MDCIAHRGFAGDYPENTVTAFRQAARDADWVECDVRRCDSGEVVVVHDETVDRVTGASGAVADLDRDELAALDVCGSGEGVPTLRNVVDPLPPAAGVVVDLKEGGLAADVADVLGGHPGGVLLSSFDGAALAEAALVCDLPLALLVERDRDERLGRAVDLGCTAIHPHWDLCDEDFVAEAHEAGLTVNAWTIRDRTAALSARAAGVDGIITDERAFCPDG